MHPSVIILLYYILYINNDGMKKRISIQLLLVTFKIITDILDIFLSLKALLFLSTIPTYI